MKVLLLAVLISGAFAFSEDDVLNFSNMTKLEIFEFSNQVSYHLWGSFIRGYYHKRSNKLVVDEQCFGNWMEEDVKVIRKFFKEVSIFNISGIDIQEAKLVANDMVDLVFLND